MNFEPNEDQKIIQEQVRKLLCEKIPLQKNLMLSESDGTCSQELWLEMSELGWLGIAIPEEYGGVGLGFMEMSFILEEMGKVVMTGPYFSSIVLGGVGVMISGTHEQKRIWLPDIASGTIKSTLALYEGPIIADNKNNISTTAKRVENGYELTGIKDFIINGDEADIIICPALLKEDGKDKVSLFVVPTGADGASIKKNKALDITRPLSSLEMKSVIVGEDHLLGRAGDGKIYLKTILDIAIAGLCSEMAGACLSLVSLATNYSKERVQFGKPIGSFQAIKHKCADMYLRAVTAEACARYAAWAADQALKGKPNELAKAASIAKAYCAEALNKNSCDSIQIYGGNGFSWDYGLHLYLRRAKACEQFFGNTQYHHESIIRKSIDYLIS